jgi:hypothetical protein
MEQGSQGIVPVVTGYKTVIMGQNYKTSVVKIGKGSNGGYTGKSYYTPSSSSGSSGSSSEPDTMDKIEDEIDPFHDVDVVINQLTDDLEDL